jgi:hypothetical protein
MRTVSKQANSPADRRSRKWRTLILLAGLALASSFFMPAVEGCNAPIVPAEEAKQLAQTGPLLWPPTLDGWAEFGAVFAVYVAAYGFGLLAAFFAFARLLRSRAWQTVLSTALLVWIVLTAFLLLLSLLGELLTSGWPRWDDILSARGILLVSAAVVVPLLVLGYVLAALRLRNRRYLCWMIAGGCWATAWFAYWMIYAVSSIDVHYGLYVSLTAACLLTLATLGEAAALTRQSWVRTLGQLLICRLAAFPEWRGHCPRCDYYLYGLTEMRCPECGRAFSFEEIGVTPEELSLTPTEGSGLALGESKAPAAKD